MTCPPLLTASDASHAVDLPPDTRSDFSRSAASTNDTRGQVETRLARGASAFLVRGISVAAIRALPDAELLGLQCSLWHALLWRTAQFAYGAMVIVGLLAGVASGCWVIWHLVIARQRHRPV